MIDDGTIKANKEDSRQDREKALYPGAACTGHGSVKKCPKKGSGENAKAGGERPEPRGQKELWLCRPART